MIRPVSQHAIIAKGGLCAPLIDAGVQAPKILEYTEYK